MPALAGFGLVNLDLVAVVPAWERDQKVRATAYLEQVGGPVPVALWAAARLGLPDPPLFLGIAGDDSERDLLERRLNGSGVDARIDAASGVRTSRSLVLLDARDGSRTLANYAEDLPCRPLRDDELAALGRSRIVHVDGRDLDGCLRAAQATRSGGGLVSYDLGTMRPGREALLRVSDIVLASRGGGAGAFPHLADDPLAQVRAFREMGARIAGVTLAERGVAVAGPDLEPTLLPAYATPTVVDTCGAGDTFHGAFLHAVLHGAGTRDAADFAQAAVSCRIRVRGNDDGLPTKATVDALRSAGHRP